MSAKDPSATSLLVHGYIRDYENSTSLSNTFPTAIVYVVHMFSKVHDTWSEQDSSKYITIQHSVYIKINKNHDSTAFGQHSITHGICRWHIKIISLSRSKSWTEPPYIGIIADNPKNITKYKDNSEWNHVGYQLNMGDGKIFGLTSNHVISTNCNSVEWNIKADDILEIFLDLNQQTLRFTLIKSNSDLDENPFIHVEGVKVDKYRIALTALMCKSSEFALLKSSNQ